MARPLVHAEFPVPQVTILFDLDIFGNIAFGALLGALILVRAYHMVKGVRASVGGLVAYAIIYIAILSAFVVGALLSVPSGETLLLAGLGTLYVGLVLLGALFARRETKRDVEFEWRPDDGWYVRTRGIWLPIVFAILFLGELGLELILVGGTYIGQIPHPLSPLEEWSLRTADALFSFVAGILVGRNLTIISRFREVRRRGPPASPDGKGLAPKDATSES
ncbi:MAG: hypothetical protein WB778_09265 [Thermoplasmata archaeon]